VILTRGKSLEVQLTELHKTGINTSVGSLGPGGREEIVRIVKETISDLNNGGSRSATKEYDEKQRQEIISVLRETKGRVSGPGGAAERLGVNRTTLLSRMRKLGIDPKQFS